MSNNQKWFIAWGVLFGASLIIAETFSPETGLYLAYGITIVTVSQSNAGIEALKWVQSKVSAGFVNPDYDDPRGGGSTGQ